MFSLSTKRVGFTSNFYFAFVRHSRCTGPSCLRNAGEPKLVRTVPRFLQDEEPQLRAQTSGAIAWLRATVRSTRQGSSLFFRASNCDPATRLVIEYHSCHPAMPAKKTKTDQ